MLALGTTLITSAALGTGVGDTLTLFQCVGLEREDGMLLSIARYCAVVGMSCA